MATKSMGVIMVYPAMAYGDPPTPLPSSPHTPTPSAPLPNLEIVSSFSVGLDKVDLPRCRQRGIRVTNTPDVLTDDVADLAIGLILADMRR